VTARPSIPRCPACGRRLRKLRIDERVVPTSNKLTAPGDHVLTADGLPRSRGNYGDNLVCGLDCGYTLAIRLVRAIPGIIDMLPPKWRPDLDPTVPQRKPALHQVEAGVEA
jgi:hypothetical protein